MKLIQCVEAWQAVQALINRDMDYATAHTLVTLRRHLRPQVEFYLSEEKKLVAELAKHDEQGKTVMKSAMEVEFETAEKAAEYARRRAELGNVEVTERFPKLNAKAPETITPAQLEALLPFIRFDKAVRK